MCTTRFTPPARHDKTVCVVSGGVRTYKRGTVNRRTINRVSLNRGHIITYTKTWLKCFTHIVMYNRPNMQKCNRVVYCSLRANRGHIITYVAATSQLLATTMVPQSNPLSCSSFPRPPSVHEQCCHCQYGCDLDPCY